MRWTKESLTGARPNVLRIQEDDFAPRHPGPREVVRERHAGRPCAEDHNVRVGGEHLVATIVPEGTGTTVLPSALRPRAAGFTVACQCETVDVYFCGKTGMVRW